MEARPGTDAAQKPVIILINPAAHLILVKADVPVDLIPVLMAVAAPEPVVLPAHLLPDQAALEVLLQAEEAAGEAQVAHCVLAEHAIQAPMLIFQNV